LKSAFFEWADAAPDTACVTDDFVERAYERHRGSLE
jgi:hypothetical protein